MKFKKNTLFYCLVILLIGCFLVSNHFSKGDNNISKTYEEKLVIHYIDVGQGDSAFIELPNQKTILIDAGEKKEGKTVANYIKNLGYNKIDYVIGTHPHSDHIGGLEEVITTFDVNNIYMPKVVATSKVYENLLLTIKNMDKSIKRASKGVNIFEEDNLSASFLSPIKEEYSNLNNYSAVLKIKYGDNTFLFMGDLEKDEEANLDDISCNVIKVGHHGSNTSSSNEFIKRANPKYAIISVGENNKYGLPSNSILKRYQENNTEVIRTDLSGTIKVTSDGSNINVSKEK